MAFEMDVCKVYDTLRTVGTPKHPESMEYITDCLQHFISNELHRLKAERVKQLLQHYYSQQHAYARQQTAFPYHQPTSYYPNV